MKIKELLTDESRWCKGHVARNKYGEKEDIESEQAVCWCLSGAIGKCYPYKDRNAISLKIRDAIVKHLGYVLGTIAFNDDKKTTFEDVRKVIELADV